MDNTSLIDAILARAEAAPRLMVAIAGPPGSGKSTLAATVADTLHRRGAAVAVVPMDGFHYDDAVLKARGLASRKGAPETFDFAGFHALLKRIRAREPEVAIPLFDRNMELSRAAAAVVEADTRMILVEGNYLLLDERPWAELTGLFDFTVYLDVPRAELERRLLARWHGHGRAAEAARRWVETNDLPNADRVMSRRRKADMVL
ncbi:nucleoside triphosphate hydrolase [Chelativorans xinjiangense]|uniref:nucleoside triphosphate hydrolase n=1 Tax=Chelativorans xinjiangense TaxID=2681485 RepID=UPI00135C419B|nr:nucleoside triphosphate hydrolase [Chelativorans xinjiangense]